MITVITMSSQKINKTSSTVPHHPFCLLLLLSSQQRAFQEEARARVGIDWVCPPPEGYCRSIDTSSFTYRSLGDGGKLLGETTQCVEGASAEGYLTQGTVGNGSAPTTYLGGESSLCGYGSEQAVGHSRAHAIRIYNAFFSFQKLPQSANIQNDLARVQWDSRYYTLITSEIFSFHDGLRTCALKIR